MAPESPARTAHPPEDRPLLVWDGECGFCRRSVDRLRYQLGQRIDCATYQEVADRFADIPRQRFADAAHLIETDGTVHVGAAAILRAGELAGGVHPVAWCYRRLPGFAPVADAVYRWIARHRSWTSSAARSLFGRDLLPRQYRLTRWIILRLLGLTALIAFLSYLWQLDGLVGEHGIMPATDYLDWRRAIGQQQGWSWYDYLSSDPTLAWISASSSFLTGLAIAGVVLSLLLIADVVPVLALFGIWLLYLSLVVVAGPFFPFQWDTLLLEALVAALLLAPWRLRPRLRSDREPSAAGVWMMRLLIFKLMLLSGLAKLAAHDPTWEQGTALSYHFFTQPIPIWSSYYAHHAPDWLLRAATVTTMLAELVLPWLVFAPRKLRLWFFAGTVMLMAGIGATGNYGFFNLLTCAIAISLLDDDLIRRLLPARLRDRTPDPTVRPRRALPWAGPVGWVIAVPLLALGLVQSCKRIDRDWQPPGPVKTAVQKTYRFHSTNAYGLFASMTTDRPEIVVEGSRDGDSWQAYRFPYKVQSPDEIPDFAWLHMPRLDWQMWFAALSRSCRSGRAAWFRMFVQRLLEGSPAVRDLLEHDPFGDRPPRYVRARLYLYSFAGDDRLGDDPSIEEGRWWRRLELGDYCPPAELGAGGRLRWVSGLR